MLQLAAPLGLLALGALVAPILIHLVRRPRRTVKIGSLRPLEKALRRNRAVRWHEAALLALRCGLLALLALSVAGLGWTQRSPSPARWLLRVPGAILGDADRAEWNQLHRDGFESRFLSPGFPLAPGAEPNVGTADVWSLLRELDLKVPNNSRVVVFGPTWSTQFVGTRPTLKRVNVSWRATQGGAVESRKASPPRVALIAASNRADDARYLRAAVTVIGATWVNDGEADWIFRLGDGELPAAWRDRMTRGARLVTDAPDREPAATVSRWFDAAAQRVRMTQRVTLNAGVPLLRDSLGDALLTEESHGAGSHWRFALRFHPDWSDWPLDSSFPAWWRVQLNAVPEDPVAISPEQAAPRYESAEPSAAAPALPGFGEIDLRGWSWVCACFLFVVERLWSRRMNRGEMNA